MKKFKFLVLGLALVFVLTACGGAEAEDPGAVDESTPNDEYRATALIRDVLNVEDNALHMVVTTEFENDFMDVEIFIKGDKVRMDSSDPEYGSMTVISNDLGDYILLNDYKAYYTSADPVANEDLSFMITEEDMAGYEVTTGQEEIDEILYDFEKFTSDEDYSIFYFIPGTDEWVALKSEDTMMYIHEISIDVDDIVFEIPSDFKEATI